ncbi:MAG: hypothetical protein CMG35_04725 [Candidatus Marinimicrobia bacterium]|nr:hypothetical protein [Candidatus Neomarinimicrobiota bacterium]|tara:strand:- start:3714 stop:4325 length:612 start_codon:yes stop_codon:yes gene_type:complete
MKCVKLTFEHKEMFYKFINTQIELHSLQKDPQWQNVKYIADDRNVYASIHDDEIQAVIANNNLPNMPWTTTDTLLARRDQSHFTNIKNISKLVKFQIDDCEERGKWGAFWIRKFDIDNVSKKGSNQLQGQNVSKFGDKMGKLYDEKYNITDAAYVKAGHMTGNKLYDHCLGGKPLPYDVTIRFVSMKFHYMNTFMRDKVTYGS